MEWGPPQSQGRDGLLAGPAAAARQRPRARRMEAPGPAPDMNAKRVDWFLLGMIAATLLAWLFPEPGAKGGA